MFSLIKNIISLAIIIGLIFLFISLWKGGEPFRWFGKKSEQAGEIIKKKSEDISKTADELKKQTEDLKEKTKMLKKELAETKNKINQTQDIKNDE